MYALSELENMIRRLLAEVGTESQRNQRGRWSNRNIATVGLRGKQQSTPLYRLISSAYHAGGVQEQNMHWLPDWTERSRPIAPGVQRLPGGDLR